MHNYKDKSRFIKFRQKLLDYPDYAIWIMQKYHTFVYFLFGLLSMLIIFGIHTWLIHIKENNNTIYTEVFADTITTIQPLVQTNRSLDNTLKSLIYLPLVRIDADSQIIPILLDAFNISNNYKNYIITIRKNAEWSDGTKITAKDVAFTYKFIQRYYPNTPLGKTLKDAKIKIINNNTIEFELHTPYVGFIRELTYPIAPYRLYHNSDISSLLQDPYPIKILTSGPYKINNINIDNIEFTAKANPNFHIKWNYQRTPETAYFEFISNRADAYVITFNNNLIIKKLRNNPTVILTKYPIIFEIKGLFVNQKSSNSYIKSLEYRRNLSYLLQPTIFTQNFDYLPAYSIYPENTQFFDSSLIKNRRNSSIQLDTVKKQVSGTSFKLSFLDIPAEKEIAQFIKNYLAHFNIQVTLDAINIEDFEYRVNQTHDFEVLLYGIKLNADPDQSAFWHSKGNLNIVSLRDSVVDRLLEKGLTTYNILEREELYKQLQNQIIQQEAVFIPLFHPNLYVAYHKNIKKLGINTTSKLLSSPIQRIFTAYPYINAYQAIK